jgi:hypothetical protein
MNDGEWGTWHEDRRYPSKDGTHLIVVPKRTNSEGRVFWKNERRRLLAANPLPGRLEKPA